MRKSALMIIGLSVVLSSCESSPTSVSPDASGATMSREAPTDSTGILGGALYNDSPQEGLPYNAPKPQHWLIYGAGFFPHGNDDWTRGDEKMSYRLYVKFKDGTRQLIGTDGHPFTVSTDVGPKYSGHPITNNGGLGVWTFVIEVHRTKPGDQAVDVWHRGIFDIELWGKSGRIGMAHGGLEF